MRSSNCQGKHGSGCLSWSRVLSLLVQAPLLPRFVLGFRPVPDEGAGLGAAAAFPVPAGIVVIGQRRGSVAGTDQDMDRGLSRVAYANRFMDQYADDALQVGP